MPAYVVTSPEYQAAREKRIGACDLNMVLVEGV
jgi:uncharacterized protein (DUF1330 family)